MPASDTQHTLELRLREIGQLFNSLDPSPFHEKDLDHDAEQFISEWAREPHRDGKEFRIRVLLERYPDQENPTPMVREAIHNYFGYQAQLQRGLLRQMMWRGERSLLIGIAFLGACVTAAGLLPNQSASHLVQTLAQGLTIAGWVAMWRPLQIFLYDWWPIRQAIRVNQRLAHAVVEVRPHIKPGAGSAPSGRP